MGDQFGSVLIGTIAAIVLVPIILAVWNRLAPPEPARESQLSDQQWQQYRSLDMEAFLIGLVSPMLLGLVLGKVDNLGVADSVFLISSIPAVYFLWHLLRLNFSKTLRKTDYSVYFEGKHDISLYSATKAGWLSTTVFLISGVASFL